MVVRTLNCYDEAQKQKNEWHKRAIYLQAIGEEIARTIVQKDISVKELRTVLDYAESKILSASKAILL